MAGELLTTQDTRTTHKKPVKRLTDVDRAFALRYQAEGLTQVQIAQRIGCDQGTISRWLSQCQDTTAEAGTYFRGQALTTAQKIVKHGKPADLIKLHQGIGVLEQDRNSQTINVLVGMPGQGVPVPTLPDVMVTFAPQILDGERKVSETLGITAGSDNLSSVTQGEPCK